MGDTVTEKKGGGKSAWIVRKWEKDYGCVEIKSVSLTLE